MRIDCLAGLEKNYGLRFKQFTPVAIGLRYAVLDKGDADLSILFTSDAQLANSTKYTILNDDKGLIPAGNVIFIASKKVADRGGPGFRRDDREGSEQPDAPGHPGAQLAGRHRQAGPGSGRPSVPEVVGLRPVMRDPQDLRLSAAKGSGAEQSLNVAARMGRWSAQHRKTAIWGWLAFVVVAFMVGGAVGTKTLDNAHLGVGESGRADRTIDARVPEERRRDGPGPERHAKRRRASRFRAAVGDVQFRLSKLPYVYAIESPYDAGQPVADLRATAAPP